MCASSAGDGLKSDAACLAERGAEFRGSGTLRLAFSLKKTAASIPLTARSLLREYGVGPLLLAQGFSACYRNSVIVFDCAPTNTDRPYNIALTILQRNATGEGDQSTVAVLDSK